MRHGKREMRKNYTPFAAGMVTMVLLIGLISASLAANTDSVPQPSGGAEPAQIGVGMFLKQQIAPGETLTTEKGGKAPKVLTYADSKGETHYYIEATAVAELFDVTYGVNFHEEANQLEFGAKGRELRNKEGNPTGEMSWSPVTSSAQRHDFNLIASGKTDENGKMDPSTVVIASEGFPATHDDGISFERHSEGREPNPDPELQKEQWARRKSLLKDKPEYGKSFGMYTEVDPAEMNLGSISGRSMDGQEFKDENNIEHTFAFTGLLGKYAAITIENTGASEAQISVHRLQTVGHGMDVFSGIYLPAGGKITRAFRIDENKPLENQLQVQAKPLGPGGVSVKLTAEQYRSGV